MPSASMRRSCCPRPSAGTACGGPAPIRITSLQNLVYRPLKCGAGLLSPLKGKRAPLGKLPPNPESHKYQANVVPQPTSKQTAGTLFHRRLP
jgi:hypothetical protein